MVSATDVFEGDVSNGDAVFIRRGVSITLELSRSGEEKWVLTKESGRRPCECEQRFGKEAESDAHHVKAYAVVNVVSGILGGPSRRHGQTYFAPLSGVAAESLLRIASSIRADCEAPHGRTDRGNTLLACVRMLSAGHFTSGLECECVLSVKEKCAACRSVGIDTADAKWWRADWYMHGGGEGRTGWRPGSSYAVGDVVMRKGGVLRWLSCPLARQL
jgi:hypothetical protein